jgi:geranylgeranyl diphosphate synthase type II
MAAGAAADAAGALAQFGMSVGLAFQYIDDILDEISSSEVLGKPVGSDQRHEKMTAVRMYGLENTRSRAAALTDQATALLERFGEHKKPLAAIARYMLERTC